MRCAGAHNWPPVWTQSGCHGNKTLRGEIGFLRQVSGDLRSTRRYYLLIDHQGERYMGAMLFDDPVFGRLIAQVLREHLDWPIQQIGGLDLSFTLGRNSGGEEIDLAKAYVLGLNRRR